MLYALDSGVDRRKGIRGFHIVRSVRRELANTTHGAVGDVVSVIVWIVWVVVEVVPSCIVEGIDTKC